MADNHNSNNESEPSAIVSTSTNVDDDTIGVITTTRNQIIIPEDIIRDFILPYTYHLQQIDQVKSLLLQKQITQQNDNHNNHRVQNIAIDAARNGKVSQLFYLIHTCQLSSHDINRAFCIAAQHGRLNLVQHLTSSHHYNFISGFHNNNNNNNYSLNPKNKDYKIIHQRPSCWHCVCDPTANNNEALKLAVENGHFPIVKYLCELVDLKQRPICDAAVDDDYPLRIAALKGYLQILHYLCTLRVVDDNDSDSSNSAYNICNTHYSLDGSGRRRKQRSKRICNPADDSDSNSDSDSDSAYNICNTHYSLDGNGRRKEQRSRRICNPAVYNNYPILIAAKSGHLDIVKYLCEIKDDTHTIHETDTNTRTTDNHPYYHYNSMNANQPLQNTLLVCDPSARNNSAIQIAAENGHLHIVQYLYGLYDITTNGRRRHICDPSANDNYALRMAAQNGYLNVVHYLCHLHDDTDDDRWEVCDPTVCDNYAIRMAATNGHFHIVKYLCTLKDVNGMLICDPSANYNEAIRMASKHGYLEIVQYLCELRNDYDGRFVCDISVHEKYAICEGIREATIHGHLIVTEYLRELQRCR